MSYFRSGLGQAESIVTLWRGTAQLRDLQTLLRSRGEVSVVDGRVDLNGATHRAVLGYATAMGLPASQVAVSEGSMTVPQSLLSAIQRGPRDTSDVIAELARDSGSTAATYSKEPGASSDGTKISIPGIGPVSIGGSGGPSWILPVAIGGAALVGVAVVAATMSRRTPKAMPKAPPLPLAANRRR
jgi:hypothetical protein